MSEFKVGDLVRVNGNFGGSDFYIGYEGNIVGIDEYDMWIVECPLCADTVKTLYCLSEELHLVYSAPTEYISAYKVPFGDIVTEGIKADKLSIDTTRHYSKGSIECVDYLYDNMPYDAFVGGLEWNIKKYLHRWRDKGAPVKDLRKARDYLSVLIEVMEGEKPKFKEWDQ